MYSYTMTELVMYSQTKEVVCAVSATTNEIGFEKS